MTHQLAVGDTLHAEYEKGQYYLAKVLVISESKRRERAPVKVKYLGYNEELWLPVTSLKSKKLPKVKVDLSVLEMGTKLQAESDGVWYAAEVLSVSTAERRANAPVKVHFVGYTAASDEWVGAGRLRSKLLRARTGDVAQPTAVKEKGERGRVLVVGSINVDLFQRACAGNVRLAGHAVDVTPIKGMTLPASSFVAQLAEELKSTGLACEAGSEEDLVLKLEGPFLQKTGGKGANAAAAAGQTFASEFIGNMGETSDNQSLIEDLRTYGSVEMSRCALLKGCPTGTAYILQFDDNDNGIVILGGANQRWPAPMVLHSGNEGPALRSAVAKCVAVMLQREIPEYVNVEAARLARELCKPVFMDVGGTDAPLSQALMPFLSVIAPNETELTFITGVDVQRAGVIKKSYLREAITVLKDRLSAAGNRKAEVLVTLGPLGSMYFGSDWANCGTESAAGLLPHEVRMGIFVLGTHDSKVVDTTGAGDCYRGSFVGSRYGLGNGVEEALRWAAAAASLSVEVEGAMPSMPPKRKISERVTGAMLCPDF